MQNKITLSDKIISLRETVGIEYTKPSKEKLEKLKDDLYLNREALDYLQKERGLNIDTIKHFQIGYDGHKNAISIPIFKNGDLINIKYRFLNPTTAKYVGESGAENWIFNEDGLKEAEKKGGVLVTEGEIDCMSVWQAGIKNVVSPASGKDSYGVWLEKLDNIKKVYIAYDNDKAGKEASAKMAERLGEERCLEIGYPDGIKDANEYFKKNTITQFKELVKTSKPFFKYQFKGVGDVINSLRSKKNDNVKSLFIPNVEMERDWLVMISGKTNVGKTSYVMNIADDLTKKGLPVLVFPFERGIDNVGRRFLQIKFDKTLQDFEFMDDNDWDKLVKECVDVPIYFAMPKKEDIVDMIIKSKRVFDTKIVIIDHLDYIIRNVQANKEAEIGNTLQTLKRVAEQNGIIMIIVTHIRKIEQAGSMIKRTPNIEDMKGSSSLYQDPECVAMLTVPEENKMEVTIVKNKGEMKNEVFDFSVSTGKLKKEFWTPDKKVNLNDIEKSKKLADEDWLKF